MKRNSTILTKKSLYCFSILLKILVTWKLKNKMLWLWYEFIKNSRFFLIFICNFNWKKFHRDVNVEIKIANRFELMIRVFQFKFKNLMKNFIEKHVFEKMKTHIYVIECQKKNCFIRIYCSSINRKMTSLRSILMSSFKLLYQIQLQNQNFTNWWRNI